MRSRRSFWRQLSKPAVAVTVVIGIALIGVLDFLSGTDIRIFPLYLLPLALAAKRLGLAGALLASLLATITWTFAQYLGGRSYPGVQIWALNFISQGSAFAVVSVLVATLELRLRRERQLGRTDALTGLLNSRAFHERATEGLSTAQRKQNCYTLAYLDLDGFKQVNDRQGHAAGDELLARIGAILRDRLGSHGLVARMGGDEFAAFLPGHDRKQATALLEEVLEAMRTSSVVAASGVTVSIGGISRKPCSASLDLLIHQADKLMYGVKQDGRNAVRIVDEDS